MAYVRRSLPGRADLLAAFERGGQELLDQLAGRVGFTRIPDLPTLPVSLPPQDSQASTKQRPLPPAQSGDPQHSQAIALWLPARFVSLGTPGKPTSGEGPSYVRITQPASPPEYRPLTPWRILANRLQAGGQRITESLHIDEDRLVDRVARREQLDPLPFRRQKTCTSDQLVIVRDTSLRMVPLANDQERVIASLRSMRHWRTVDVLAGSHPQCLTWDTPATDDDDAADELHTSDHPHSGSQVLVLGDLGCLESARLQKAWLRWAHRQKGRDCSLLALVPCSVRRVRRALQAVMRVVSWQRHQQAWVTDPAQRDAILDQLLLLASPAIRIEPGLLRDLIQLVPNAGDASLEVSFWMHRQLLSNHPTAATLQSSQQQALRQEFARVDDEDRRQEAVDVIRRWHCQLIDAPEIWLEEFLNLPEWLRSQLPEADRQDAYACVRQLLSEKNGADHEAAEESRVYLTRATSKMRLTAAALADKVVGTALGETQAELHPKLARLGTPPPGEVRSLRCDVDDESIAVSHAQANPLQPGFVIQSSTDFITVSEHSAVKTQNFWKTRPPDCVSDFGTDDFGKWCEVRIPRVSGDGFVTHRFRWIEPGKFLMGSPAEEEGRYDNEGPQHEVTISRGFWLGETACPQSSWEAVMGENPADFKGANRPVENVSWEDVRTFFARVSDQVPGLNLRLPTEAQWEYACRAKSTSVFHSGDRITAEEVNYAGNYPYGDRPRGEYRSETVAVKSFSPNAWGLYEMHGNVWEWCEDWYDASYYESSPTVDPVGPESGSDRVVRGGGWNSVAAYLRSACRNWSVPGTRDGSLGFRCLSSAESQDRTPNK